MYLALINVNFYYLGQVTREKNECDHDKPTNEAFLLS